MFSNGESTPTHFSTHQCMHSFQIPSNAHQTAFILNRDYPAQQKLPESLYLFNNAKWSEDTHRFPRALSDDASVLKNKNGDLPVYAPHKAGEGDLFL